MSRGAVFFCDVGDWSGVSSDLLRFAPDAKAGDIIIAWGTAIPGPVLAVVHRGPHDLRDRLLISPHDPHRALVLGVLVHMNAAYAELESRVGVLEAATRAPLSVDEQVRSRDTRAETEREQPLYFCAGPSCPGYSWKASEQAHPTSCTEPKAGSR